MIVDAQLHEPGLQRHWDAVDEQTQHMALTEALHTLLAAVGVDGAVLHPIEDVGWAHGVAAAAPDRFVVVPMVVVFIVVLRVARLAIQASVRAPSKVIP